MSLNEGMISEMDKMQNEKQDASFLRYAKNLSKATLGFDSPVFREKEYDGATVEQVANEIVKAGEKSYYESSDNSPDKRLVNLSEKDAKVLSSLEVPQSAIDEIVARNAKMKELDDKSDTVYGYIANKRSILILIFSSLFISIATCLLISNVQVFSIVGFVFSTFAGVLSLVMIALMIFCSISDSYSKKSDCINRTPVKSFSPIIGMINSHSITDHQWRDLEAILNESLVKDNESNSVTSERGRKLLLSDVFVKNDSDEVVEV